METYLVKRHGEKFLAQNVMEMKETIQCQRSSISEKDWAADRPKEDAIQFYVKQGYIYGPGYIWLLVSPGQLFFHCNARTRQEGAVHPDIFVKLPIEWLKINEALDNGFDSKNGFVSQFINSGIIAFDIYTHLNLKIESHSIVDTVEASKLFDSNAPIPCVENWNNNVKDSDVVAKNDNHLIVETIEVQKL